MSLGMSPPSDITNEENTNKELKEQQVWRPEQEKLLSTWAEKAACYRWLHNKSEIYWRKMNLRFTIPIIIMSTLTGTANFGITNLFEENSPNIRYAQCGIGLANIFVGILGTIQTFLRCAELLEGHRVVAIQWGKFYRNIEAELAYDRKFRSGSKDFVKMCRAEYDRLIEQSPSVPNCIFFLFKKVLRKIDKDGETLHFISIPDIANGLSKVRVQKPKKESSSNNDDELTPLCSKSGFIEMFSKKNN